MQNQNHLLILGMRRSVSNKDKTEINYGIINLILET